MRRHQGRSADTHRRCHQGAGRRLHRHRAGDRADARQHHLAGDGRADDRCPRRLSPFPDHRKEHLMADTMLDERTETDITGIDEMPNYGPPAAVDQVSVIAKTEVITAQRVALPRDYGRIMQRLKALAAMSGEDWYYRFPVKNRRENRTDYIEGPSVKCATAVAREYGNCAVDC